jgi:hypothetical protein
MFTVIQSRRWTRSAEGRSKDPLPEPAQTVAAGGRASEGERSRSDVTRRTRFFEDRSDRPAWREPVAPMPVQMVFEFNYLKIGNPRVELWSEVGTCTARTGRQSVRFVVERDGLSAACLRTAVGSLSWFLACCRHIGAPFSALRIPQTLAWVATGSLSLGHQMSKKVAQISSAMMQEDRGCPRLP